MDATGELPTVEQPKLTESERTAEIDLDDLGLDVRELEDLPAGLGEAQNAGDRTSDTREQPKLDYDDLLSATGVTQVLEEETDGAVLSDQDATLLAPGFDDDTLTGTEVLEQVRDGDTGDTTSKTARFSGLGDDGIDLNLDDLSAALEGAETVEQPGQAPFADVFGGGAYTPLDLDVGLEVAGADEPTGTEDMSPLDPQTMTEVGTKLDLARAYIDMGDPEGARSILEEVLDEGDNTQRREAQTLIDVLSA
jgi:pilus assembly protein FimV